MKQNWIPDTDNKNLQPRYKNGIEHFEMKSAPNL